ncbi:hypothetical protein J7T55_001569 [Diaporthe amygdali]|uniref:uncharacterized protein n=1 Tax=Phomopsis amygdali TaxID=1214568 RepID=UPI0022FE9A04|nr:uncharacterized protein J7T55_001569 [Diaporthe amygdali]KAJ0115159.1 hypothetical protein J7T55_001569 [Diaporthe amygdali]
MFQQRAAQRLLTTMRPYVARRMIATQPPKAAQETVSKSAFFTSVVAFSGATVRDTAKRTSSWRLHCDTEELSLRRAGYPGAENAPT